jgi:hypothetical protein
LEFAAVDERERRVAQNESHFRGINEHLEGTAAALTRLDQQVYEFLCECANRDCARPIPLRLDEYERVRANARRFLVAPGHQLDEVETVVDQYEDVLVIEKHGEAAALVEGTDPRR